MRVLLIGASGQLGLALGSAFGMSNELAATAHDHAKRVGVRPGFATAQLHSATGRSAAKRRDRRRVGGSMGLSDIHGRPGAYDSLPGRTRRGGDVSCDGTGID